MHRRELTTESGFNVLAWAAGYSTILCVWSIVFEDGRHEPQLPVFTALCNLIPCWIAASPMMDFSQEKDRKFLRLCFFEPWAAM